jgi:Ni,Fe-hydrogenase I small subunit
MAGVDEVPVLWTSEGMSCDGDTVSMTAAMRPSIEDVVLGVVPGLPKVHLQNKVMAFETGGEFMETFFRAARANWTRSSSWWRGRPEREDQRRRLLDLDGERSGDR